MTASISGYVASGDTGPHLTTRFYQSKSVLENRARTAVGDGQQKIPPTAFANYAKAHAYPNGNLPGKSATLAVPGARVLSSEPSMSPPPISNLSPSLQAAASQALPPFPDFVNRIPPIAETRPSTAVAASHPLPGPQALIDFMTPRGGRIGDGIPLAFGSTTKIVPLPVTTTRPLPLVDQQKRMARPAVILTAEEYSLRPSIPRYPGTTLTAPRSRMDPNLRDPRGFNVSGTSASHLSGYTFPSQSAPVAIHSFDAPLGPFDIPPGFTSVNPPGRSFIAKKKQGSQEEKNKSTNRGSQEEKNKSTNSKVPSTSAQNSGTTYREKEKRVSTDPSIPKDKKTKSDHNGQPRTGGGSKYDVAPFRLIDLQNSVVTVKDVPNQAKRPRGRPPGVKNKKQKVAEPAPSREVTDEESETSAGSTETTQQEVSEVLRLKTWVVLI